VKSQELCPSKIFMIGEEKAVIATTILSDHENCGAETVPGPSANPREL